MVNDNNILFVGPKGKGGIKAVTDTYATEFSPFKIVYSQTDGSRLAKVAFALGAYCRFIATLATDRQIRIVHVHSSVRGSFWRKSIFIKLALLFNKKVIFHSHSGSLKDFYKVHTEKVRSILDRCNSIVALSEQWKSFFASVGYADKCTVINNPIVAPVKIRRTVNDGRKHILFVGKICPEKGVFDMMDMIISHKDDFDGKVCFHIAGNDQVERLRSIIEDNGLSSIVKFEGWISGDRKRELFSNSDIFILPSYIEGVPVAILEAMSYGVPVIATDVGGVASVVKDNVTGLFISPGDKTQMYDAINRLITDDDLCRRLTESASRICNDYIMGEVKESLFRLYNRL